MYCIFLPILIEIEKNKNKIINDLQVKTNYYLKIISLITFSMITVFAGFISYICQYFFDLISVRLFIVILSATSNFEKREAIRNTWLKDLVSNQNVEYIFALGQDCQIPLLDRISPSLCLEWNDTSIDLPNIDRWYSVSSYLRSKKQNNFIKNIPWYNGYGFKVLHISNLLSIGCHVKLLSFGKNVTTQLRDAEETFFHLNISRDSCDLIKDDFCYRHLRSKSLILPKDFEGELLMNGKVVVPSSSKKFTKCSWDNGSSIHYTFGRTGHTIEAFNYNRCSYVSAQFEIQDSKSLINHFEEKSDRKAKWLNELGNINERIKEENKIYRDIVLLDNVIDVYKNLPRKIIEAFKWVNLNYRPQYVLKVDDDTYVNVKKFNEILSEDDFSTSPPTIWSHFIHHLSVPIFGKWADHDYHGLTYPTFPSGAGYLISDSLLTLIMETFSYLKLYQGEDITMGIWTESLKDQFGNYVDRREVSCWLPSKSCKKPYLIPQLDIERMIKVHEKLKSNDK